MPSRQGIRRRTEDQEFSDQVAAGPAETAFPGNGGDGITRSIRKYKKILDEAFLMLLDGKLRSHTEIVKFLESILSAGTARHRPTAPSGRAKKEAAPGTPGDQVPKKPWTQAEDAVAAPHLRLRQQNLQLSLLHLLLRRSAKQTAAKLKRPLRHQ